MIRKRVVIAILIAFCLTATLLMVRPIRSQANSAPPYNPWLDTNCDGKIDMTDVINVLEDFGATGTPLNQTELLEANNTIATLESELQVAISEMNPSDKGIEIDSVDWNRTSLAGAGITDVVVRNLCVDNVTVTSLKLFWTSGGGYLASSVAVDVVIAGNSTANIQDFLPINGWNTVYDTWTLEVYTLEGYTATSGPLQLVI